MSFLFTVNYKCCTCNLQEGNDLLDHVNKVKAFANELACLEVYVQKENIS